MFETNTASCGGFAGISDSFGAALWGLDYAMQMAHSNFSGALMHIGGQNVFYNVRLTITLTNANNNLLLFQSRSLVSTWSFRDSLCHGVCYTLILRKRLSSTSHQPIYISPMDYRSHLLFYPRNG